MYGVLFARFLKFTGASQVLLKRAEAAPAGDKEKRRSDSRKDLLASRISLNSFEHSTSFIYLDLELSLAFFHSSHFLCFSIRGSNTFFLIQLFSRTCCPSTIGP